MKKFLHLQSVSNVPIMKAFIYHTMGVLPLLLLAAVLTGCGNSNRQKAYALLGEARIAMVQNEYERARQLIDSLRSTYPKETDCRRAALVFSDSLELHEAKHEFAKADSSFTFKQLELEDMKRGFVLEKDEKYQSVGNYVVPSQAGSKTHLSFFAEVSEDGTMQLVSINRQRKYSYTTVSLGDDRGSLALLPPNATAEDALVVEQCYRLAKCFAETKACEEEVKRLMVKIRFYEKKLEKDK